MGCCVRHCRVGALSTHTFTSHPHKRMCAGHIFHIMWRTMNKTIISQYCIHAVRRESTGVHYWKLNGKWSFALAKTWWSVKLKFIFLFDAEHLDEFITSFNFSPFAIILIFIWIAENNNNTTRKGQNRWNSHIFCVLLFGFLFTMIHVYMQLGYCDVWLTFATISFSFTWIANCRCHFRCCKTGIRRENISLFCCLSGDQWS